MNKHKQTYRGLLWGFWCPVPIQVRTNEKTYRETYRVGLMQGQCFIFGALCPSESGLMNKHIVNISRRFDWVTQVKDPQSLRRKQSGKHIRSTGCPLCTCTQNAGLVAERHCDLCTLLPYPASDYCKPHASTICLGKCPKLFVDAPPISQAFVAAAPSVSHETLPAPVGDRVTVQR